MDEKDLVNNLLVELECPICINYMQPPIRLCKRGHSICNECAKRLITCPTCKADISDDARCFALEKLFEKLTRFSCHNIARGCAFRAFDDATLNRHKRACPYKELECLFGKEEYCKWRGTADAMLEHCLAAHKGKTETATEIDSYIVDFAARIPNNKFYSSVIYAYGQLFKLVRSFNLATGFFGYCVFRLSSEANTPEEDYQFKVTFFEKKRWTGKAISVSGFCPSVRFDEIPKELDRHLMGNNLAFFKNFCKDKNLHYKLNIIKPCGEE